MIKRTQARSIFLSSLKMLTPACLQCFVQIGFYYFFSEANVYDFNYILRFFHILFLSTFFYQLKLV